MIGIHPILMDGIEIGQANVERQGLYYHISCHCSLEPGFYRIWMCCSGTNEQLGICVLQENRFGLEKRIPVKRIVDGIPVFTVTSTEENTESEFVKISTEEPFGWLEYIPDAKLQVKNGVVGVMIKKNPAQSQPGSDLSHEYRNKSEQR